MPACCLSSPYARSKSSRPLPVPYHRAALCDSDQSFREQRANASAYLYDCQSRSDKAGSKTNSGSRYCNGPSSRSDPSLFKRRHQGNRRHSKRTDRHRKSKLKESFTVRAFGKLVHFTQLQAATDVCLESCQNGASPRMADGNVGFRTTHQKHEKSASRKFRALFYQQPHWEWKTRWRNVSNKLSPCAGQAALETVIALATIMMLTTVFIKNFISLSTVWKKEVQTPWFKKY